MCDFNVDLISLEMYISIIKYWNLVYAQNINNVYNRFKLNQIKVTNINALHYGKILIKILVSKPKTIKTEY